MVTFCEAVTLFLRMQGPEGCEAFARRVIRGVSWHSRTGAQLREGRLLAQRRVSVRIPVGADTGGAGYVAPGDFAGQAGAWTLRAGDYMARGEVALPERMAELGRRTECMMIAAWSDLRRGGLAHWRAEGE